MENQKQKKDLSPIAIEILEIIKTLGYEYTMHHDYCLWFQLQSDAIIYTHTLKLLANYPLNINYAGGTLNLIFNIGID
jgi:hypothetical protein